MLLAFAIAEHAPSVSLLLVLTLFLFFSNKQFHRRKKGSEITETRASAVCCDLEVIVSSC
jgi:hypothetical protein